MKQMAALLLALFATSALGARAPDTVFLPGVVSTAAAEIRLAISPDGRRMLWGSIGRGADRDQQDIWERHRDGAGWSAPARVSFDTEAVEFDPAFSPDGRRVYFHSDRPGGFGGTDIYVVDLDPNTGRFATPRNLGAGVNSKGEEWAPTPTARGTLIFASDGWGGFGKHDLFEVRRGAKSGRPMNLGPAINGAEEDFDGALSGDVLVFSSGSMDDDAIPVRLFISERSGKGWSPRRPVGEPCSNFVNGSSFDPRDPSRFFYAAKCDGGEGRMDIRETRSPIAARP